MLVFPFNPEAGVTLLKPSGEVSLSPPNGELSFSFPLGVLVHEGFVEGVLFIASSPLGASILRPSPEGSFSALSPIGELEQVFFTPVLALDDGYSFLWLDDGARLRIDY